MDRTAYGNDLELKKKLLLYKEDKTTEDIYEITNIADRMNLRFKNDEDDIAIIAKENLLIKPFHGIPNSEYPSPWLTVNYREFGALIKACAYVLKKKYDLYPNSRVGIIANFTPINHMLIYALWYNRCSVVQIPVKLGNEVKQFWTRILNLKMIFYDVNFTPFDDEESIRMMKEQDEWIWKWQHPLTENEMDLEAGKEGILAVNLYGENFRNEILEAKNQGKSFERKCYDTDVIYIIGTSSSSQAIIKNGQCSKMKFVPITTVQAGEDYNYCHQKNLKIKPTYMINIPVSHALGFYGCVLHNIQYGGAVVYHTQQLRDIGFIPEIILDDMVETNVDHTTLFPFHINEIKKLFESNHPNCEKWKKFISTRSENFFKSGGSPISEETDNWLLETFGIRIYQNYGSSEVGQVMISDFYIPSLPGEELYFSKLPTVDLYIKPINENDPNIGELYVHSPTMTTGYIKKAEKGEFYESNVPGMRTDIEADSLFTYINGEKFYKTNDIWMRSPKSGKYKYISRTDDIIVFSTSLKMNPLPFENTVSYECNDIIRCCLILDDTKTEVVCFVEPQWKNIILENGQPMDITIDPSTLSKKEIEKLNKIAQKQIWYSIYTLLMDDSKSLTSWAKQLTINNVVIIDYGKKLACTAKGSVSRRIIRLEYDYVLKKISKLISGEIKSIDDNSEVAAKEYTPISEKSNTEIKNSLELTSPKEISNSSEEDQENEEVYKGKDDKPTKPIINSTKQINNKIDKAIRTIHESIKEIIPSTPKFEEFDPESPFSLYGIDSLASIKLANILSRKFKKRYSPAILFNYGTSVLLAKYLTSYEKVSIKNVVESIPKEIQSKTSNKIAIIGMAFRLPGSINNSKSLWMALAKGKDCVLPPIKTRDLHHGYVNKSSEALGPEEHYLPRIGCYDIRSKDAKPSEFDAAFFNCSHDEAVALDPRHQNAGIAPNSLENTLTGVYVGINNEHEHEDLLKKCGIVPPLGSHTLNQSSIAGRLSYFYKLFGPSFTIDTACSTGSSALHIACNAMKRGECDLSIVTGVKYMYSSKEFHKTCSAHMTSPKGRCATFDASADGFAQSEGCVTFVLKRLDDAIRDKDNILTVILGSVSGQSGLRQSISAPSYEGQALNIERAMKIAGISPDQVSYVEAHGTGTPLGDAIEIHALNEVYAGSHSKENPLIVGSIKSNIGHTCEAAGLAGIAKVIVSMKHNSIPKIIHFNKLNPEIDTSLIPMKIPTRLLPWKSSNEDEPLIAQVSSFGLQGSIVVTFLQQYIPKQEEKVCEKENHILTISAKTYPALVDLFDDYIKILDNMDNEDDISELCFTSNIGRQHFNYRLVASGRNSFELYQSLKEEMEKLKCYYEDESIGSDTESATIKEEDSDTTINITSLKESSKSQGISLYFYVENNHNIISKEIFQCAFDLYIRQPSFKKAIQECEKEIKKLTNRKYSLIKDILFLGNESKEEINYLGNIIILALNYAFGKVISTTHTIKNALLIGYGFGELSAILHANGCTFGATAQLIKLLTSTNVGSIFKSVKEWYQSNEKNFTPLTSNIFLLSNHHEYKIDEKIPLNSWISMIKILLNLEKLNNQYYTKGNHFIFENYGKIIKEINIFTIQPELSCMIKDSFSVFLDELEISKKKLFNFFIFNLSTMEDCEKSFIDYIKENYILGDTINWKNFHKRHNPNTKMEYSLHKIELPNYPFQRSIFWPSKIN
ncbi:hypothetical protein U3516DRAFT_647398 [Neocallimastix sp. 'constans']